MPLNVLKIRLHQFIKGGKPYAEDHTVLWFDDNAEEAMEFYLSIFKNSHVIRVTCYMEGAPFLEGRIPLNAIFVEPFA